LRRLAPAWRAAKRACACAPLPGVLTVDALARAAVPAEWGYAAVLDSLDDKDSVQRPRMPVSQMQTVHMTGPT
jgi:hypothetical protein